MRKEAILILTVLLFATYSYAACDITSTIDKGVSKSYTSNGKDYVIKFSSLTNESGSFVVKFEVNGASTTDLGRGDKHIFDDLSEITIIQISKGSGSVNDSAQICLSTGLSGKKGTCSSNNECDDSDTCTIDECDGDPLRCHHKLILWCKNDDGCCPESRCTAEKDNDCSAQPEFINNSDIELNDSLINDSSSQTLIRQNQAKITECVSGDDYCPDNCTFISDPDCDECSEDKNCSDDNACTSDSCSGTPKVCFNNATAGCNFQEKCITTGTTTESQFCSINNIMEPLKGKKEYCNNDYECLNNSCIENMCKNPSFISKITGWFKGLFGK